MQGLWPAFDVSSLSFYLFTGIELKSMFNEEEMIQYESFTIQLEFLVNFLLGIAGLQVEEE